MLGGPFSNEATCCARPDLASQKFASEQERSLLALVVRVKVRGLMLRWYMRMMMPKNVEMMGTRQSRLPGEAGDTGCQV